MTSLQQFAHQLAVRLSAAELMRQAGMVPDPWQRRMLGDEAMEILILCSRQAGKSTVTAALALHQLLKKDGALVLLLSPAERQSEILFEKVLAFYQAAGEPVAAKSVSRRRLHLANGSKILALPGSEKTVRGFSDVDLLVVDEASRVDDELYRTVRPMLAVSRGRFVALTTPFGRRGWFYEEWQRGRAGVSTYRVTAREVPRITDDFLEAERESMGERWFAQEYLCSFSDPEGAAFREQDIEAAFAADLPPLFDARAALRLGAGRAGLC